MRPRALITATVVAGSLALLASGVQTLAQAPPLSLSPTAPPPSPAKPAAKPAAPKAAKPVAAKPVAAKPVVAKPVATKPAATTQAKPAVPEVRAASIPGHEPDLAFGAYQRGYYLTAFSIATRRVNEQKDVKSMTLLGELYANGFGVDHDDAKAADWYKLAADRGDREAMFALAMFRMSGRGGLPASRDEGAKLLAAAAKLGHPTAAYDLALLYMEGQLFPQDFARAAELLRSAAQAGSPEAQYALATLYKDGHGVEKSDTEAARWLALAAQADETDAQVEYAIALFNGTGVAKDEAAAVVLLKKAARKGNPVAQNRLANLLAIGRAITANPVEAIKWHLVARAGGATDLKLDDFMQKQSADVRAAAEKAAQPWIEAIKATRS
jgi:TPR repeat protein